MPDNRTAKTISTAILLCAGRGSRLRPATDTTPKPLLPVDGEPTLELVLRSLHSAGIKNLVLITHHLAEQIEHYMQVRSGPTFDQWQCVRQTQLAGTADAVLAALHALPSWFSGDYLVTATDYIVWPSFYPDLVNFHGSHDADITISLKAMPESELGMRSSVRFNEHEYVLEVVEKPAPGEAPSSISANLVYIVPAAISPLIGEVDPSVRGEKEIQTAVNVYLADTGTARGLVQATPQEWQPC